MSIRMWVDRILFAIAGTLLIAIAIGTIAAFASHKAKPGVLLRRAEPVSAQLLETQPDAQNGVKKLAFTGLGQIRAPLKAAQNTQMPDAETQLVLVAPWFLYPGDDTPFYEELSAKNRKLKVIFSDYFSRWTLAELLDKGETDVKKELLSLVNDELTLGKLSEIYFDEYMFFD